MERGRAVVGSRENFNYDDRGYSSPSNQYGELLEDNNYNDNYNNRN